MAKTSTARNSRRDSVGFVVERRGSDVYVNGRKVLAPKGKTSVSRAKIRKAVYGVMSK